MDICDTICSVGRPIAVDWAVSKECYQKAVEHSGTTAALAEFISLLPLATLQRSMLRCCLFVPYRLSVL